MPRSNSKKTEPRALRRLLARRIDVGVLLRAGAVLCGLFTGACCVTAFAAASVNVLDPGERLLRRDVRFVAGLRVSEAALERAANKTLVARDRVAGQLFALLNDTRATADAPWPGAADRPADGSVRLTVVLYANEQEYERYGPPGAPASHGRYQPITRELHLPASADPATHRHEWTHILLAHTRPDSPRWLHEGLAIFLEDFDGSTACAGDTNPARPPERIWPALIDLQERTKQDSSTWRRALRDPHDLTFEAAATALVFYLWEQRALGRALRAGERADVPDITAWLTRGGFTRARPGC